MMSEDTSQPIEKYIAPCPECQSGVMHLQYLTYFTWLNEELITVPNFPAWVCDLCGRREYDNRAITWLNTLLTPEAKRVTSRQRKRPINLNRGRSSYKPSQG